MKNTKKGFTLIELLVVVAIIAILALIVMLALNPVEMARRSRDSRRLSDMETLRKSIDLALADGKTLSSGSSNSGTGKTGCDSADNYIGGLDVCKYLSVLPQDPSYEEDSAEVVKNVQDDCSTADSAKGAMVYNYESDGDVYILSTALESKDNCSAVKGDGKTGDNLYTLGTAPNLELPEAEPTLTPEP